MSHNDQIDIILSILDYILYRKENETYKKYLVKYYNYNIPYISPIQIIIIPRTIYIFTDNIKDNYTQKVLKYYIDLLYNIHKKINKSKIKILEYHNMCTVKAFQDKKNISIIRGNTLSNLNESDYEIWIYIDSSCSKNMTKHFTNNIDTSNIDSYRIIICNSSIITNLNEKMSVSIYLDDNIYM